MSKHYTAEEAKKLLDTIPPAPYGRDGFHDVTDKSGKLIAYIDDAEGHWVAIDPVIVAAISTPRLAETVIAQAEQIGRLQSYIRQLESNSYYQRYIRDGSGLEPADMEEQ